MFISDTVPLKMGNSRVHNSDADATLVQSWTDIIDLKVTQDSRQNIANELFVSVNRDYTCQ